MHIIPTLDVLHCYTISWKHRLQLHSPGFCGSKYRIFLGKVYRKCRVSEMVNELIISIVEQKVIMDEGVTRDDAEEVDEAFRRRPNDAAEELTPACYRVENGKINV